MFSCTYLNRCAYVVQRVCCTHLEVVTFHINLTQQRHPYVLVAFLPLRPSSASYTATAQVMPECFLDSLCWNVLVYMHVRTYSSGVELQECIHTYIRISRPWVSCSKRNTPLKACSIYYIHTRMAEQVGTLPIQHTLSSKVCALPVMGSACAIRCGDDEIHRVRVPHCCLGV